MMKKIFAAILFAIAANSYANHPNAAFEKWLKDGMKKHDIPAVSIALVRDYQLVWAKGFGLADVEKNKPVTPETVFQAGSISKPVTAMAALIAVEQGKLSLDQDVNLVLTSWQVPNSKKYPVTLRKLLSHSAGFNVPGFLGYENAEKIPSLIAVLNGLPPANSLPIRVTHPLNSPKKKFEYSGGGYTVVQQILVDLYQPFPQTMAQMVLQPLNMNHSTFQQPLPDQFNDVAMPYRPNGQMVEGGPHSYPEMAAAGLWSTPSDLAKFVISIQKSLKGEKDQLLSKKYAQLLAVKTESKAPSVDMGLGMEVNLNEKGEPTKHGYYFSHRGQNAGYRNLLIGSVTNGNGIIIMTNMSPAQNEPAGNGWKFISAIEKKLNAFLIAG